MFRSLPLFTFLSWILLALSGCKQGRCPDTQKSFNLTPTGPMLVQGQQAGNLWILVQYPTDCDGFAYRGNLTLQIEDATGVPGARLYFKQGGEETTTWSNQGFTPASGTDSVQVFLTPVLVNGVPSTLTPGSYSMLLNGTFDDPQDTDEVILKIEVLDEGLNLFLTAPEQGKAFPEGTDEIELKGLASDMTYGIESVSYRIDRGDDQGTRTGEWITQTYPKHEQVELNEILIPDSSDQYKWVVQVVNGQGDVITDSVSFSVEKSGGNPTPITLTNIYWDGEGDGIHWHDPLNWEGDIVPDQRHEARARTGTVSEIVITSTGTLQDVYRVGSLNLGCDLTIKDGAILQIESTTRQSKIFQDLRFIQNSSDTDLWSAIRFDNRGGEDTIKLFAKFIEMPTSRFEGASPAIINSQTINSDNDRDYPEQTAYGILQGQVLFKTGSYVTFLRSFTWEFKNGATLEANGSWRVAGGLTLRQDLTDPIMSRFINRDGTILINGSTNGRENAELRVEGPIQFLNHNRFIQVKNKSNPNQPAKAFFYSYTGDAINELGGFQITGEAFIYYGKWTAKTEISEIQADRLMVGSLDLTNAPAPSLFMDGPVFSLEHIQVDRGRLQVAGAERMNSSNFTNKYESIEIGREGAFYTHSEIGPGDEPNVPENIFVKHLALKGGSFYLAYGDSLFCPHLTWGRCKPEIEFVYRGPVEKPVYQAGVLVIEPSFNGLESTLDFNTEVRFAHNILIQPGGILAWISGSINHDVGEVSFGQDDTMNIAAGGYFWVDTDVNQSWDNWLLVYNQGFVFKRGSGDVVIAGCLFNFNGGQFAQVGGDLDFEHRRNPACD